MFNDMLVQKALGKLSPEDTLIFQQSYRPRAKSNAMAYALWFCLGWHYAYLGQWGMQAVYWLSLGGLGAWALLDLFRLPKLVENANRDAAIRTLHDLQLVSDGFRLEPRLVRPN